MSYELIGLCALGGLGAIVATFKSIDWLISQKYKTKDDCDKCRADLFDRLNDDKNLLCEINTKVDLLMGYFNLLPKNKD